MGHQDDQLFNYYPINYSLKEGTEKLAEVNCFNETILSNLRPKEISLIRQSIASNNQEIESITNIRFSDIVSRKFNKISISEFNKSPICEWVVGKVISPAISIKNLLKLTKCGVAKDRNSFYFRASSHNNKKPSFLIVEIHK